VCYNVGTYGDEGKKNKEDFIRELGQVKASKLDLFRMALELFIGNDKTVTRYSFKIHIFYV